MRRHIVINNCSECHFLDHSGSATKGGSWPVCHGPGVVDWGVVVDSMKKSEGYNNPNAGKLWSPPILPVDNMVDRNRTYEIPDWCPLEIYDE